jgi:acyl-CoA thioester hydrolase
MMNTFEKKIDIRWADLDPNFHVLHSRYYDFGAYCRMAFLVENGFTPAVMMKKRIGPILFREECIFKKEIVFGDEVTINVKLEKTTSDYAKWTMRHEIYKTDNILSAIITVDGAWLNTAERKVALPPQELIDLFEKAPRSENFTIVERTAK